MASRRMLLKSATAALTLSALIPGMAVAADPTRVVATFSILGDMVERIGGEHVTVSTLVGPNGDGHVYQPTPSAARDVSQAEVLIFNGLEFEGWLDRLVEASNFSGELVVATAGIEPIAFEEGHDDHDDHSDDKHDDHDDHAEDKHDDHDDHEGENHADHGDDHHGHNHGVFDPHAWQSLTLAVTYVDNITAALAKADPANAASFYENRAAYVAEIEALNAEISTLFGALPEDKRTVVTSHDAFQYFGKEYGLTFLAPQGLSTESDVSAKDIAELIEHMREDGISAVFLENITDARLLEQIANETDATIGGTLYPGALSDADGPASTYLDMIRHNASTLAAALGS
ncbi:MAG: zinc ABC transporter substrate-binding protein [Paracoccaceae bacterium]